MELLAKKQLDNVDVKKAGKEKLVKSIKVSNFQRMKNFQMYNIPQERRNKQISNYNDFLKSAFISLKTILFNKNSLLSGGNNAT